MEIEVEIFLFGRFRRLEPTRDIRLRCEAGISVAGIRRRLAEKWRDVDSVADSVLALENKILPDDECIFEPARFALLPPVCGG